LTHPVIASLDHPLFACGGKRVAAMPWILSLFGKRKEIKMVPLKL